MSYVTRAQGVLRLLIVIVTAGYAGVAFGQVTPDPSNEKPPASEARTDPQPEPKTDAATQAPPVVEKITVTGTRFERLIDLTPQSMTVMDSKELHAHPMSNIQTILDDAPGISIQRSGALDAQLSVRGLSSLDSRVVMFINGDRFRGRNFLEYSLLDPNEIERIEIIRGPAAALYGSDAMNGVVNVITRRATGDTSQAFTFTPRLYSLGYSSTNNLAAGRLELQGLGNGFDMLIGGNYRKAGNYDSPAGEVPNSDFATRSLTARIGYALNATRRLELTAKASSNDAGRAGSPGAPLVITREDPLKERFARLAYTESQVTPWMQDLDSSLYYRSLSSILRSERHTASNGSVDTTNSFVVGPYETGGKLLARTILGKSVLAYGVDFYHEDAPSYQDEETIVDKTGKILFFNPRADRVRDASQTVSGALIHDDWDPSSQLTVSLGGRYDLVETKLDPTPAPGENPALSAAFARNLNARDNALTGSAGVIFRPTPMLHLVGNISSAFRAPTTGDKSGDGQLGALNTLPNADLKPESSVSYEVGARVRLPGLNLNLTTYRTNYTDLIAYKFLDATTRVRVNIGKSKTEGFEVDGTYEMSKALSWRFNAANVRATDTLTGAPLAYVPPLNGLVGVRHTWPDGSSWVELTGRWSTDKTRIDPTQERSIDGYEVFSLYGGIDLSRFQPMLKSYRLTVGIDNLTDKLYRSPATREIAGFPRTFTNPLVEPGRSLSINITAGF